MKVLTYITIILISVFNHPDEKEFLKFISDHNEIVIFTKDIIEIDPSNNLLTLSNEALNKLSNINTKSSQAYILDPNNNKWIKVDLLDARDSKRGTNPIILTNKNKLLFYSDDQIVISGELWFSISESHHIKVKNGKQ